MEKLSDHLHQTEDRKAQEETHVASNVSQEVPSTVQHMISVQLESVWELEIGIKYDQGYYFTYNNEG